MALELKAQYDSQVAGREKSKSRLVMSFGKLKATASVTSLPTSSNLLILPKQFQKLSRWDDQTFKYMSL